MKKLLLKSMLLLCALIVGGASSVWAADAWEETSLSNLTSSDIFVIVGSNYAITNNNGTSSAPSAVAVTIANSKITSAVNANMKWNVSGNATNGYTFYPNGTTETWLYCNTTASSSSNNNMRVGTGDRKVFEQNSSGYIVTKDQNTARYLSLYNNQDWRGYINTTNGACEIKFYKRVDAVVSFTITTAVNDANMGSASLNVNTITATPNSGYRVKAGDEGYTVTAGTATVTNNGNNTFTVDPTSNCTVQINFEAIPTHQVTFSVNGATTNQDFAEGAAITFPAKPDDIYGKTFVGWTTSTLAVTTNTAPQLVNSATMGNANQTYYAVFAKLSSETQDFVINTSTSGIPTSYADAAYYTLGSTAVFNIHQMYYSSGEGRIQFKANAGKIYNNTPMINIQSIIVTYSNANNYRNLTLKVGTTENPTEGTSIIPTNSDLVFTFDTSEGNYNYFLLANGANAGYITSLVINYYGYKNYCTTVTNKQAPELAYTVPSYKVVGGLASFPTPELSMANGVTGIVYSSTDTDVASVNTSTGAITIGTKIGTTTITASLTGSATFEDGSASYTITTIDNKGTETNPYTVAEALAKIETLGSSTLSGVYVEGIITGDPSVSTQYNNADYFITVDGDNNSDKLKVYRGKYLGNTNFTTDNQNGIANGDKVVIYGALQKYNNTTPQFTQNNYIVQLKHSTNAEVKSITVTADKYNTFVAPENLTVPVGVTAYIATGETSSTLTLTSVPKIKAGTPVILYANITSKTNYAFEIYNGEVNYSNTNLLKISDGTTINGVFVLAKNGTEVGFYKWMGGALSPGKVYVDAPAGAREYLGFAFGDEEATGVNEMKAQKVDGQFYDLQGRKVANPSKGLYIVNGKKVVIK